VSQQGSDVFNLKALGKAKLNLDIRYFALINIKCNLSYTHFSQGFNDDIDLLISNDDMQEICQEIVKIYVYIPLEFKY
jgi:hypothetical protein